MAINAPLLQDRSEYEAWVHAWMRDKFLSETTQWDKNDSDWRNHWFGTTDRGLPWLAESMYWETLHLSEKPDVRKYEESGLDWPSAYQKWLADVTRLFSVLEVAGHPPEIPSSDIADTLRKEPRLRILPLGGSPRAPGVRYALNSIQATIDVQAMLHEDMRKIALRDPLFEVWHFALLLGE